MLLNYNALGPGKGGKWNISATKALVTSIPAGVGWGLLKD